MRSGGVVVSFILGVLLAVIGARELVEAQSRGSAVMFAIGAAVFFFLASFFGAQLVGGAIGGFMHWFTTWVLASVAMLTFGYFAIRWTEHHSVALRILADICVSVLAGGAAVLPAFVSAVTVAQGLRGVAAATSSAGDYAAAYTEQLAAQEAAWRPPPRRRLAALVSRCVVMSVTGMAVSLIGQVIAYRVSGSTRAADFLVPALGWLVGSAAGWTVFGMFIPFTPARHRTRHVVQALGLAWLVLTLTTGFFAAAAAHSATSRLLQRDGSMSYAPGAMVRSGLDDQALAEALKPDFRFASRDRDPWRPTSVNWFLATKSIQRSFVVDPQAKRKVALCEKSCYALPCDDLEGSCTRDAPVALLMYALVKPVSNIPKPYDDVSKIVQYWLFYNYDSFSRWLLSQWHQGDWEQVTVGLAGEKPRFVAYSEHCFGTWLPWDHVAVTDSTHPVVFVAEGTHANYPRRFEAPLRGSKCLHLSPPKYLGAAGLAISMIEAGGSIEVTGDYAFGETDHMSDEREQIDVQTINPSDEIAAFSGTWGLDNLYAIAHGNSRILGRGPDSPVNHDEWKTPADSILCDQSWFTVRRPVCRARS